MADLFENNNESNEEEVDMLAEGDLIEMIDDDGNPVSFIFVDSLEYVGGLYLALAEPEEDDAVFFLKIEQDEDGNDVYSAPEEELENTLFEQFLKQREQEDNE